MVAAAILLSALSTTAQGRGKAKDAWRLDPYTRADPAAMKRAGYVSFGPFVWGDGHDTSQIEHVLGEEVKLLWVETAHFRIGCSLPPYKIPQERDEKRKLAAELGELRSVLPTVKPRAKKLDRWLRLHLFARRFESTYVDFCERLKVTDGDFPSKPGELKGGVNMGEGPFLGQPAKFTVLLFEKKSSAGHYVRTFLEMEPSGAQRHNFLATGSLLYLTSTEFAAGTLSNDTALHCEAVFNVVHGLLDGYRYFWHQVPHWFGQGLAHWYLRRISEKHNVFNEYKRFDNKPEMLWNWPPRIRARVKFDQFRPFTELMEWQPEDEKTLVDSMMLWSRVDFLMSRGAEAFPVFMNLIKGPIPMQGRMPTREEIQDRCAFAVQQAWGFDGQALDAAWKTWVLETYPKR